MSQKSGSNYSQYGSNRTVIPSKSGYKIDAISLDRDTPSPNIVKDSTDLRTKRSGSGKKSY